MTKINDKAAFLKITMPLPKGLTWEEAIEERTNLARRVRERKQTLKAKRPQQFVLILTEESNPTGLLLFTSDGLTPQNIDLYKGVSKHGEPFFEELLDLTDVISHVQPLKSHLNSIPIGRNSYLNSAGDRRVSITFRTSNIHEAEAILKLIYGDGNVVGLGIQPHVERPHGRFRIKKTKPVNR